MLPLRERVSISPGGYDVSNSYSRCRFIAHTADLSALAPLSLDQLALSAAPNLRSIDELACHIIAVRAGWFHEVLDEGAEDFGAFSQ